LENAYLELERGEWRKKRKMIQRLQKGKERGGPSSSRRKEKREKSERPGF